jgi:hypothetical protein
MASLKGIADGIENAERIGGVTLDKVRRPGFAGGTAVRIRGGAQVEGIPFDPEPDVDPDPDGEG